MKQWRGTGRERLRRRTDLLSTARFLRAHAISSLSAHIYGFGFCLLHRRCRVIRARE